MPWLQNLQETYDANVNEVGTVRKNRFGQKYTLIPIGHTTQNAHVEVNITEDGNFHSAFVLEKEDMNTVIPTTVDSGSRSGTAVFPYPLHDNLKYTAGDYVKYGGKIGKENPYDTYINQLRDWVESRYTHKTIKSIYSYLKKARLIEDLVNEKVLFLDENDQLIQKWNNTYEALLGEKPKIFSTITGNQDSAFIRFNVHSPDEVYVKPWHDRSLFTAFTNYYSEQVGNEDLCYVTGKILPSTEKHTNKIRHAADKAKLISGNDSSGFTFRGRFNKSKEVASISYLASQKAHNALKWLIDKQGRIVDGRVFLIWGNNQVNIVSPWEDSFSVNNQINENVATSTEEIFAEEFSKAIDGYKNNLDQDTQVNVLVLDSATTGRMGVLYYRNLEKDFFFEKVKDWHTSCVWRHTFVQDKQRVYFYGAPATRDIAIAAYGSHVNEKLIKGLMERMLPCIIEGRNIPTDIIRSAFYRASNPVSMESWEWEKTLSVTCALINKKERLTVALDKNNDDRDYLFGRMLAVADVLERSAMRSDEQRATNAIRYMSSFAKHPARTWAIIQDAIQPYQARLGRKATYFTSLIDEIGSKMKVEDFNDRPLSGKYLLGLYSQRHELYQKRENEENKQEGA